MSIELKMPALSPTMEKGTLARWLVAVGDTVKPGDLLAEIETDKATLDFEAVDAGRVASLVVSEGTNDVAVGTTIALIVDDGDAVPAPMAEEIVAVQPIAAPPAPAPSLPIPVIAPEPVAPARATAELVLHRTTVTATPLARRIATGKKLSMDGIRGTGPNGRIVKADLGLASLLTPLPAPSPASVVAPVTVTAPIYDPPAGVPVETVKLSTMRKTIARRLTESKQTVPHFYLTAQCNIDALLRLRGELNAALSARGLKLSVNDLLIKAMALAMIAVPDVNVQYGGDVLHQFSRVDIAMAVAIDGGLVTPVIRNAGALSLSALALTSRELAARAREGRLLPEEYQGGTASISNLGMFGIDQMFPVINPAQAIILGVAAGIEQPWKVANDIALATILAATASFDHRVIDGATGARFMAALRELIEVPLQIVG